MTRNEIIEQLYKDDRINDCISKMHPKELQEDLKAEIFLILLEYPETKIKELHQSNQLVYFTLKIITNQVKSNTSKFTKKFKDCKTVYGVDISDRAEEVYTEERPKSLDEIVIKIKGLAYKSIPDFLDLPDINWYNQLMLSLYMKHGTYREMARVTKIPRPSCFLTVKETIDKLTKYASK